MIIAFIFTLSMSCWAKPLYVIAGGFSSCSFTKSPDSYSWGSAIKSSFLRSFNLHINQNFDQAYIVSCFSFDLKSDEQSMKKSKLTITNSLTPEYERKIRLKEYANYVNKFFQDNKEELELDELVFIGHSHGAYYFIKNFEKFSKLPISQIITADMISKDKCGALDYAKSLLLLHVNNECQKFPSDLSQDHLSYVLNTSGASWHNAYQLDFNWLHSNSSKHESINDLELQGSNHMTINEDLRLWALVN